MPTAPPTPILVAHLFREISPQLVSLLQELNADEWHLPTVSSKRCVKDIVTHLLDGSLRRLSMQRDGYFAPDGQVCQQAGESMVEFLNRLNAEWEIATRRLSPPVLLRLVEWADEQLADLFESLDPQGPAIFAVDWAGESESRNWMDVARDYTEKWHHTQQIFEATGRPSTIVEPSLFHPCLDTFMRAMPVAFRAAEAQQGTTVCVMIEGEAGGEWFVTRGADGWIQTLESSHSPSARFVIGQDSAWKLFTKRMDRDAARSRFADIKIEGDTQLGSYLIDMVSVMA